jgi:hypothetical protein
VLSSLCAVHCVLGIVIVAGLGLGGGLLLRELMGKKRAQQASVP